MRLTVYSDYSLRVLMYLALNRGQKTTLHDISESYAISKEHLRKVVHHLVREELIASRRGRLGGLTLRRSPRDINIGAVVRMTEREFHLVECFDDATNQCVLKGHCGLQQVLGKALQAFLAVLDTYSLEDLIRDRHPMRTSLGL